MCDVRTLTKLFCLCWIVLGSAHGFAPAWNVTRTRRQAAEKCQGGFRCQSGECIDTDKECDGLVDCADVSDETDACKRIKCPPYLFRCRYGACINPELECDGKQDCRDGSDEATSSPRCKRGTSTKACTKAEFQCSSGQCIDADRKCDGQADCNDQSDEISATCWNVRCPGFTYRCKYGACVNGDAKCNGKVECFDGSDEDPSICKDTPNPLEPTTTTTTTRRPPPPPPGSEGKCVLPPYPVNGQWSVYGFPGHLSPGGRVDDGTILQVGCKTQHKLEGSQTSFCSKGTWSGSIGKCIKTCPSIYSTDTLTVTCTDQGGEKPNCTEPVDGTRAKFKCAFFYEDPILDRTPIDLCRDGSWSRSSPKCVPVCGRKTGTVTPLVISGKPVKRGNYPWMVALYTKTDKELICGGTLITQNTILTAAHCVTGARGVRLPTEEYLVAVGKYYRKFNDSRDAEDAQFSKLKEMYIPDAYKGDIRNFQGDIAILVTVQVFVLSQRVQPACVDTGQIYNDRLNHKQIGYVNGWGYTKETGDPSEVLKELEVPYIGYTQCDQSLSEEYQSFLTGDKICAGFLDNSTAVCSGDSGGGLVFNHDGRYYITGIVSISPQSKQTGATCDSQQYGIYTRVSSYINDFILTRTSIV